MVSDLIILENLERDINYSFNDKELLKLALTHSSFTNENGLTSFDSNERLEFLGDSVLDLAVAKLLYNLPKQKLEGDMSKLRAKLVNEKTLHYVAEKIDLGSYIKLGNGEVHNGGAQRPSITSSAIEAIIGAVFLDGGYLCAEKIVDLMLRDLMENPKKLDMVFEDYKTILQEYSQSLGSGEPVYTLIEENGPDHEKTFSVMVRLNNNMEKGIGTGKSKKEAERMAAKMLLGKLYEK